MLDRSVTPGRSPSSSVLSAGCCQWQPTAATPAKSNPPKYRKNSHTLSREEQDYIIDVVNTFYADRGQ